MSFGEGLFFKTLEKQEKIYFKLEIKNFIFSESILKDCRSMMLVLLKQKKNRKFKYTFSITDVGYGKCILHIIMFNTNDLDKS